MTLDSDQRPRAITFFGAPLTGKTTLLSAYANARGVPCRTITDEWFGRVTARITHRDMTFDLETIQGEARDGGASWFESLSRAIAMIVVVDARWFQSVTGAPNRDLLSKFPLPDVGCVVYTKCDLLEPHQLVDESFIRGGPFADWPRFEARTDMPASLIAPANWVLDHFW